MFKNARVVKAKRGILFFQQVMCGYTGAFTIRAILSVPEFQYLEIVVGLNKFLNPPLVELIIYFLVSLPVSSKRSHNRFLVFCPRYYFYFLYIHHVLWAVHYILRRSWVRNLKKNLICLLFSFWTRVRHLQKRSHRGLLLEYNFPFLFPFTHHLLFIPEVHFFVTFFVMVGVLLPALFLE